MQHPGVYGRHCTDPGHLTARNMFSLARETWGDVCTRLDRHVAAGLNSRLLTSVSSGTLKVAGATRRHGRLPGPIAATDLPTGLTCLKARRMRQGSSEAHGNVTASGPLRNNR